jgi:hypothetical protein
LRSKVKVSQRSLRYVTHHLIFMHQHTKYNWPIWKDKLEAPRNLYSSPGYNNMSINLDNFGKKIINVASSLQTPSTKKFGQGFPL